MKPASLIPILLILCIVSSGCSALGIGQTTSNILFWDDFTDTNKKWNQVTGASGSTDYYNGAYRITVSVPAQEAWANPWNQSFTDTRSEVDTAPNGGPDDNDFGIICRYVNAQQFYFGAISSDGYYGIMKMTASGIVQLGETAMKESDRVSHGPAVNHLRFDCIGSTLSLYVNGFLLDQQTDVEYASGNVGLLAGTFATPGTDILFDNFYVFKPDAGSQ